MIGVAMSRSSLESSAASIAASSGLGSPNLVRLRALLEAQTARSTGRDADPPDL